MEKMIESDEQIIFWKQLLYDSSRLAIDKGVDVVDNNPQMFHSLLELAMASESKFSQRAARVVYYIIEKNPENYTGYIELFLNKIHETEDDSLKFTFMKMFTVLPLPVDDEKLGFLTNICFDAIELQTERIALKLYASEVLFRISKKVPEIKQEFYYTLKKYSQNTKISFSNRAAQIIKSLQKEIILVDEFE